MLKPFFTAAIWNWREGKKRLLKEEKFKKKKKRNRHERQEAKKADKKARQEDGLAGRRTKSSLLDEYRKVIYQLRFFEDCFCCCWLIGFLQQFHGTKRKSWSFRRTGGTSKYRQKLDLCLQRNISQITAAPHTIKFPYKKLKKNLVWDWNLYSSRKTNSSSEETNAVEKR